jgi:hypothetical protein
MGLGAWSGRPPASLAPALALATPRSSYQPACLPVCPASPVTASHALAWLACLSWPDLPRLAADALLPFQPGPTNLARLDQRAWPAASTLQQACPPDGTRYSFTNALLWTINAGYPVNYSSLLIVAHPIPSGNSFLRGYCVTQTSFLFGNHLCCGLAPEASPSSATRLATFRAYS